uniref:L-type lectin-domain containing receptor kinase IX.1-like n=1 Tax=Erigeron canadensis TaxID=72917 RepID=UPI001CB8E6C8|nr:L-type lectin-domain containing receptor kinase IX.1-like [Erigeron canadensis]
MAFFSMTHKIISFLFVLIPYAASLTFNLINITPRNQNLDILIQGEGANISNSEIQLTPDLVNSDLTRYAGRAIYAKPLHLWDIRSGELASFSTNFTFVIDSNYSTSYGDGLTFFLAQNNSLVRIGASMGLPLHGEPNSAASQFVAVEFDTFWNPEWDPVIGNDTIMGDHVGIDVSSLSSAKSKKWLSDVTGGGVCQAWITYDSVSKNLSVSFTGYQNNTVIRQDGLFHTVDLREELPEWVIFGFSAATGNFFQSNTVRSWTFSSSALKVDVNNQMPPPPSPEFLNPKPGSVNGKNSKVGLIVGVSVAIAFIVVLTIFLLWKRKKNKRRHNETEKTLVDTNKKAKFVTDMGPKEFSYDELAQSTSNFTESTRLGEGGFGGVYKGFLKDSNTYVAIKRLSKSSKQGIKEYASEVNIISQLRHRNLVQLTGWCHEKGELLLVYEYMENGSLDSHLFRAKSLLKWDTRYRIANCLASAVLYLHEEWEKCVLHRDIKSSNVMLDSNFNAKLGDFGLAKLVDHEKGLHTTVLAGTLGYMAPECARTGKSSKESDVFSFGVVALEIACGRKPLEYKAEEKKIWLLEWVWELYWSGTLLEAVDPLLMSDFKEDELKTLMIVGLWCVHPVSELRPSMRQVIQVLKSEATLPILPSKMPISSYWIPSIPQHTPSNMASNRDSSNQSLYVGR